MVCKSQNPEMEVALNMADRSVMYVEVKRHSLAMTHSSFSSAFYISIFIDDDVANVRC